MPSVKDDLVVRNRHYLAEELYARVREDPEIFDFLQEGSLDGIWFWDLEQPQHEWMSERFKGLFGYTDDEVPNTSSWWQENIHPDDLSEAAANFERHKLDPSHPYDQVVRYRHKNGSTVWVRCRGLMIRDETGRPIRMLGAHQDVTEFKRAIGQLERMRDGLEARNAELDAFVGVVAHDLRAPLRHISTLAAMLETDGGDLGEGTALDRVRQIRERARWMGRMLDGLLAYAQLGQSLSVSEIVALDEVVDDFVELLVDEHADAVYVHRPMPKVLVPRLWLEQIVQNLVSNAVKHHDGALPLKVEIRGEVGLSHVTLHVSDNGPGVPANQRERVFRMFERLTSTGSATGIGAGLAIVSKLVSRMGGDVTIGEGLDDRGATFSVRLPHDVSQRLEETS